jgi:hypothetical protein
MPLGVDGDYEVSFTWTSPASMLISPLKHSGWESEVRADAPADGTVSEMGPRAAHRQHSRANADFGMGTYLAQTRGA